MKTVILTGPASSEEAIREGQTEDVIVVRDGKPVAIVVPFDEDDLEWYSREQGPEFVASIKRAREQVRSGQTIDHDELKREMGL